MSACHIKENHLKNSFEKCEMRYRNCLIIEIVKLLALNIHLLLLYKKKSIFILLLV